MLKSAPTSFRKQLRVALMFVALFPVGLVLLLTGTKNRSSIAETEFTKAEEAANRVSIDLERYLRALEGFATELRLDPMLNDPATPEIARERELQRLVSESDLVNSAERMFSPELSKLISVETGDADSMSVVWRVSLEGTGEIVELHAPMAKIWKIVDTVQLGRLGGAMLLDETGKVLAHRNKVLIHTRPNLENLGEKNEIYTNSVGNTFYTISHPVTSPTGGSDLQHKLVFLIPAEPINMLILQTGVWQLGIGLLTSIIAWILGTVLAGRLAKGVETAALVAHAVAEGHTSARMPKEGPKEMQRLGEAFNEMINKLESHQEGLENLVKERTRDLEAVAAQLQAAHDASEDGVWLVSIHGEPLSHNRAFCSLFGVTDKDMDIANIGQAVLRRFEESDAVMNWMGEAFQSPDTGPKQGRWALRDCENGMLAGYWAPVRNEIGQTFAVLFAFRDLTQEYQLQAELEDARRMETLGNLTGSIAHEFNNLLTSVIGNIELTRLEQDEDSPLKEAHESANRAVEMVRGLLGFSQQNWLEIEPVSLRDVVTRIQSRYASSSKQLIWEHDYSAGLWPLAVDRAKIQQVFDELFANAEEVSPAGGTIRIAARNVEEDDGLRVWIQISDQGPGVSQDVLDRMFEPFYSTKRDRRGLGLAMCHGVIEQHGGSISCQPNPNGGLTFCLSMNAADPSEATAQPAEQVPHLAAADEDEKSVLVVDDDPRVRLVTEAILRKGGYRVLSAENGVQALDAYRKLGSSISLVVLDLRMPGMMGTEVLAQLRRDHDYVPVVICSGYLGDFEADRLEGMIGPQAFLEKPVSAMQLLETAEEAIGLSS